MQDYNWKGGGTTETAFQMAVQRRDTNLLKLLLKYGADANTPTVHEAHTMRYDGRTSEAPIHFAAQSGLVDMMEIFLEFGIIVCRERRERSDREVFLEYGADANTPTVHKAHTMRYDGRTSAAPIHFAAQSGLLDMMENLV
jgi:ankyrin repeat protein